MTQIIAFTGYKRTGKSTAAKYLIEQHGFVSHGFKDALVAEIKERFPDLLPCIARAELVDESQLFSKKPPLMRALMQNYGTEVRRGDNDTYWIEQWVTKMQIKFYRNEIRENSPGIVTDDVRFLNEAEAVKVQQGTIIRLTRPDLPTGGDHSSETEQDEIQADYTIECEQGDFETLYRELDRIVHELQPRND